VQDIAGQHETILGSMVAGARVWIWDAGRDQASGMEGAGMIIAILALEVSVLAILTIFLIREYRRQAVYRDSIRRDTEAINQICRNWKL
jgi:uncharacterized membrane protein